MRVAMVGPFGFQPNKTMRSRALGLARPLAAAGHQLAIFMPPWQTPDRANRTWQEDGVELYYTALGGGVLPTARRLQRATEAWRPDVIHCFKPKAYSGLVAWWLWYFRRDQYRLVTDTDDWEGWGGWNEIAPYSAWQKRFFAWQEQWGLRHCHYLTVASRALETIALSHGVEPDRILYLPNGPGINAQPPEGGDRRRELNLKGRPVLLLYTRLFEFDTGRLVAVLSAVRQAVPDLAILLVGATLHQADAPRLRQQLAAADLTGALTDVGWASEPDLPALLATADVALYLMDDTLLNRAKCPVKLADLVQAGLPVVAEEVGQVGEYVVAGRTGCLRASGDVPGLAADVVALLADAERRRRMSQAAREHARVHFGWQRLSERLLRVYATGDTNPQTESRE